MPDDGEMEISEEVSQRNIPKGDFLREKDKRYPCIVAGTCQFICLFVLLFHLFDASRKFLV